MAISTPSSSRKHNGKRSWKYYFTSSQTLLILIITLTLLLLLSSYYALGGITTSSHYIPPPLLNYDINGISPLQNDNEARTNDTKERNSTTTVLENNVNNTTYRRQKNEIGETALESRIRTMVQPPQKIFVLPNITESEAKGELSHFIFDGIHKTTVLERIFDIDDTDAVWVVDMVRFGCLSDLVPLVWHIWNRRGQAKDNRQPWRIYLIDFNDAYVVNTECVDRINAIFMNRHFNNTKSSNITKIDHDDTNIDTNKNDTVKSSLHYALRRHVEGRAIRGLIRGKDDTPFSRLGKRINFNTVKGINGVVRVLRYGVRSDLVQLIQQQQHQIQIQNSFNNNTDIITWSRPNDVAHFWDPSSLQNAGYLRSAVSKALIKFSKEQPSLTVLAKQVGSRYGVGRNEAQESYVSTMLQHKIVVVCQRDMWEGHYRLMEAFASGAMVMTDPMHPLPYRIEDRKEVIVYRSIAELKKLAKYFLDHEEERLAIARSGYNAAMRFHQSGTWMERIIFGDWDKEHGDG